MLLATAYGMPLGVARVKSLEAFVRLVAEKNVLFYWWYPDNTFNDLQPQQVFLPSIREEVFAGKSVSTNLKAEAPLVYELISRMSVTIAELQDLLKVNSSETLPEAACDWLRSNETWKNWMGMPACAGYWNSGRCMECQRGARSCGDTSELLPGFYATVESPNDIFQCFGYAYTRPSSRCPGGPAGTCAHGRDPGSLACSACLPGYMPHGAECVQCEAGAEPVLWLTLLVSMMVLLLGIVHVLLILASSSRPTSTSLLHAEIGICELAAFVQIIELIRQFNIKWSEPINFLWRVLDGFRLDSLAETQCLFRASIPSEMKRYVIMSFMVPVVIIVVPSLIHLLLTICWRNLDMHHLYRTIGTLYVTFFITVTASLTIPFRCETHPSGLRTLQVFPEVFCDWQGEHLALVACFGVASILPIVFLAYCLWIMCQYPKRLHNGDSKFMRSCAFLALRLRPGQELFSLFLLFRNVLLVLCPLFQTCSARVASMSLLLMASLVVTVRRQPWRANGSNFIDVLMHVSVLLILDLIALHGYEEIENSARSHSHDMFAVNIVVVLVLVAFLVIIVYGCVRYFWIRRRKKFDFFICHHKAGAGSLARLIKMELQRRQNGVQVFVDSDQLMDLTQPLCYVGYEVETLILLGTPKVLLQKWCVAEMAIARLQNIHSVLVGLPDFRMPDATFITNYMTIAPDMHDLASYGIGIREIKDTILWVCKLDSVSLPDMQPSSLNSVIDSLTSSHGPALNMNASSPDIAIVADPQNMTATATAYVLWGLMEPELFVEGMGSCIVLSEGQVLPQEMISMLFLCSEGCFDTHQVLEWLLQACEMPECFVLPVLIEDHFQFPSAEFYGDIFKNKTLRDHEYHQAFIETVFLEAAGVFAPSRSLAGSELANQAFQLLQRIRSRTRSRVKKRPLGRTHSFADPSDRLKVYMKKQGTLLQKLASMVFSNKKETNNSEVVSSCSAFSSHTEEAEKLPSDVEAAEAETMEEVEI